MKPEVSLLRKLAGLSLRSLSLLGWVAIGVVGARAQSLIRSVPGVSGHKLGCAVIDAGDRNGDGWDDYLVGLPAAYGNGGVACVSGKYLATGVTSSTVYYFFASGLGTSNSKFGSSIASLGDVNGDGVTDFAIGAPDHYDGSLGYCGGVYFFDGATHAINSLPIEGSGVHVHLGSSMAATGDMNGDGKGDVIAGGTGGYGQARLISGALLASNPGESAVLKTFSLGPSPTQFGHAVLGNVDFDLDGVRDIVVAGPYADQTGGTDQGLVRIYSGAAGYPVLADFWGQNQNGLGRSLAGGADFDGDLRPDIVAGAFKDDAGSSRGKVVVLSAGKLIQATPPYEIFAWSGPSGFAPASGFGASVAITPDLNADGRADILVGMPGWNTSLVHGAGSEGALAIHSGESGTRIGWFTGMYFERLGSAVLGTLEDFDSDGYLDFLVTGTDADVPATDCGVLKALRLFPSAPATYCTGKTNSLGCTPHVAPSGIASASSGTPFNVRAYNVLNNKNGLLFYGFAPNAVPFQGGVLCVKPPTMRTVIQSSGGSASGNDCTGVFVFDFNAHIQSGVDPLLVVGEEILGQYWSRDPASPSTTSLSNALSFLVNP